jgi:hypothetical protein
MHGQTVCHLHGGAAPQNLRKAEERLRDLVHPAISKLGDLLEEADSDAARLGAIKYVLDWAGFKATEKLQTDQQITISVVREEQPIVLEQTTYRALNSNGNSNGHPHD